MAGTNLTNGGLGGQVIRTLKLDFYPKRRILTDYNQKALSFLS